MKKDASRFLLAAAPGSLEHIIEQIKTQLINPSMRFLVPLAIVFFLWGVFQFISHSDDPEAIETGKRHIIWSIVGITIMLMVVGILALIQKTIQSIT